MGKFKGVIKLSGGDDIEKDILVLSGDKETMGIILAMLDPALIIKPKIGNKKDLANAIKYGVSLIVIALGDSEIPKEVLIESLKFCEVRK